MTSQDPGGRESPDGNPRAALGEAGPLGPVAAPVPSVATPPPTPQLGLATFTVIVGFVGLIASLVVLGSIAEGVRSAGSVCARYVGHTIPSWRRLAGPRCRHECPDRHRLEPGHPAPLVAGHHLARHDTPDQPRRLPRIGDRRKSRPASDDEAVLRPATTATPVGKGPARFQLSERAHDERGDLLWGARADPLVGVRATHRPGRTGHRRAPVAGRGRQPDLSRLSLPDGRRRWHARRDRLAVGRGGCVSVLGRRGGVGARQHCTARSPDDAGVRPGKASERSRQRGDRDRGPRPAQGSRLEGRQPRREPQRAARTSGQKGGQGRLRRSDRRGRRRRGGSSRVGLVGNGGCPGHHPNGNRQPPGR